MVFTWLRSATPLARPRSCGISFAGRLTAILQIDQGHDDACPDPFVVWLVLRLAHEGEQVFSQGNKLRLRQADRGPLEHDLSSFPCFLGHTCRGNIGPCGLKHGTEKISELKRGSLVAGWLNVRWSVYPLDLAPPEGGGTPQSQSAWPVRVGQGGSRAGQVPCRPTLPVLWAHSDSLRLSRHDGHLSLYEVGRMDKAWWKTLRGSQRALICWSRG